MSDSKLTFRRYQDGDNQPGPWNKDVVDDGEAFMTDGCPGEKGEPGCTRPYGSYRPSEPIRDYPFQPNADDLIDIRSELALGDIYQREI